MAKYSNEHVVTELKRLLGVKSDVQLAELLETKKQNVNQFEKSSGNTIAHSIISTLLDINYELEREVGDLKAALNELDTPT